MSSYSLRPFHRANKQTPPPNMKENTDSEKSAVYYVYIELIENLMCIIIVLIIVTMDIPSVQITFTRPNRRLVTHPVNKNSPQRANRKAQKKTQKDNEPQKPLTETLRWLSNTKKTQKLNRKNSQKCARPSALRTLTTKKFSKKIKNKPL